jgi:micrococcal nuclease
MRFGDGGGMTSPGEFGRRGADVANPAAATPRRRGLRVPFLAVALGFAAAGGATTLAVDALLPRLADAANGGVSAAASPSADTRAVQFRICGSGPRITCVVDGDTIWFEGVKIRVADIDTPEVSRPRCGSELVRGQDATRRLTALLNEGPFEIAREDWPDQDRYGRKLRVLKRGGASLGETLVAEGLAVRWGSGRPDWC